MFDVQYLVIHAHSSTPSKKARLLSSRKIILTTKTSIALQQNSPRWHKEHSQASGKHVVLSRNREPRSPAQSSSGGASLRFFGFLFASSGDFVRPRVRGNVRHCRWYSKRPLAAQEPVFHVLAITKLNRRFTGCLGDPRLGQSRCQSFLGFRSGKPGGFTVRRVACAVGLLTSPFWYAIIFFAKSSKRLMV